MAIISIARDSASESPRLVSFSSSSVRTFLSASIAAERRTFMSGEDGYSALVRAFGDLRMAAAGPSSERTSHVTPRGPTLDGGLDEEPTLDLASSSSTPLWYLPNAKEPVCAAAAAAADTEASRRRLESTRRLDPGVVPGLGVARAAPTARAGCATLLGPPDMPAKSAGPVSHDPSGVLNRSSKVGVSIPQLPVPAATSRGSKSGEVTGRVPRRPVTHSPGGVGACSRAWRGVRGCDTRGVGSGEAGVSSGSRDFHAGRKCSNKRGVVRAGTYRLSRRPARIGGADTPLAGPGRHSSRRARRLASLRSVLQRRPPARQEGRKDVKQNRWWSAIDLGSWARTLAASESFPSPRPGDFASRHGGVDTGMAREAPGGHVVRRDLLRRLPRPPSGRRLRRHRSQAPSEDPRGATRGEKRSSRSGTRANHRAGELAGGEGL